MRLKPECKNGGSRPFQSRDIESRVSRRLEKLFFLVEILSFSDLLESLVSNRGPLDLSAKMDALDPSRAGLSSQMSEPELFVL